MPCVGFQAAANREGCAYNVGGDFVSLVSAATSLAHVNRVRFVIVTSVGERSSRSSTVDLETIDRR